MWAAAIRRCSPRAGRGTPSDCSPSATSTTRIGPEAARPPRLSLGTGPGAERTHYTHVATSTSSTRRPARRARPRWHRAGGSTVGDHAAPDHRTRGRLAHQAQLERDLEQLDAGDQLAERPRPASAGSSTAAHGTRGGPPPSSRIRLASGATSTSIGPGHHTGDRGGIVPRRPSSTNPPPTSATVAPPAAAPAVVIRAARCDRSNRSPRAVATTRTIRATSTASAHNGFGTGIPRPPLRPLPRQPGASLVQSNALAHALPRRTGYAAQLYSSRTSARRTPSLVLLMLIAKRHLLGPWFPRSSAGLPLPGCSRARGQFRGWRHGG